MNSKLFLLFVFFISLYGCKVVAQQEERIEYHDIQSLSSPSSHNEKHCFDGKRVEELIKKGKKNEDNIPIISDSDFDSLTVDELIYHVLNYPEKGYSSNRDSLSKYWSKQIHLFLPDLFDKKLSRRQHEALQEKVGLVEYYICKCIENTPELSLGFKRFIVEHRHYYDYEHYYYFIPKLIDKIENAKDFDTFDLTILIEILEGENYESFENSNVYKKMDEADEFYIPLRKKYVKEIVALSRKFYEEEAGKIEYNLSSINYLLSTNHDNEEHCFDGKRFREFTKNIQEDDYNGLSGEDFFETLTAQELIYYAICCPESYHQNCRSGTAYLSKNWNQEIHYDLPAHFMKSQSLSDRQEKALKENIDSVQYYVKKCIQNTPKLSLDFKTFLIETNAYYCIPELIDKLENSEEFDTFVLTILINMLSEGNYNLPSRKQHKKINKASERWMKKYVEEIISLSRKFYKEKLQ